MLLIIINLFLKTKILRFYTKRLENSVISLKINITKNKKKEKRDKPLKNCQKKELLQLYIENRTQFYINGRQEIMKNIGSKYNDSDIKTFQDKINWLLIHDSSELKSNIVDKILLREYSKKILGKDICVPIIKIYNDINEIKLNELPEKFVLKCNHGSGMNIICKNKTEFNISNAKEKLKKWMKINYGLKNYEYQYIRIKRKMFAETFLKDNITDYKFYCFNGNPKLIKVQSKYIDGIKMYHYYDLNWTITDIETNLTGNIKLSSVKFPRPKYLKLMINYAKKFSHYFTFVRVDLYEFNKTVYLSELTFSPANAISPFKDEKQRIYLGNLLDLSKVIIKNNSI